MCSLSTVKQWQLVCPSWQKTQTTFPIFNTSKDVETPEAMCALTAARDVKAKLQDVCTSTVVSTEVKISPLCALKPSYAIVTKD